MWISGPPFLTRSSEEWPSSTIELRKCLVQDPEIEHEVVVNELLVPTQEESSTITHIIRYYSLWTRLRKAVAWILRLKKTKGISFVMNLSSHSKIPLINRSINSDLESGVVNFP